jgi:hypothetical protein
MISMVGSFENGSTSTARLRSSAATARHRHLVTPPARVGESHTVAGALLNRHLSHTLRGALSDVAARVMSRLLGTRPNP